MNIININNGKILGNYSVLYKTLNKTGEFLINPPQSNKTITFVAKQFKFNVPTNHELAKYISVKTDQVYTGCIRAFELIYIILDIHNKFNNEFFSISMNDVKFTNHVIDKIKDIADFAVIYDIKLIYEYLENLFTLYNANYSCFIYNYRFIKNVALSKQSNVLKAIFTRLKEETKIELNEEEECKKILNMNGNYINDLFAHTIKPSTIYNNHKFLLEHLIYLVEKELYDKIPRPPIVVTDILFQFAANQKITLNSKFLETECSSKYFDFIPKEMEYDQQKYEKFYSLNLPKKIMCLIRFNLAMLG
jgi:hypothetical protein